MIRKSAYLLLGLASTLAGQNFPSPPANQGGANLSQFYVLPLLPRVSPPQFDDPVKREYDQRFEALWRELAKSQNGTIAAGDPFAQLTTFLKRRAEDLQSRYGPRDERSIAALEDIGIGASIRDPASATAALDRAIQLREAEGPGSFAYWRDLQRRCNLGGALQICEQALAIRTAQPDASALEIAARTWDLASGMAGQSPAKWMQYGFRAMQLYAQAPGVSLAFLAGECRYISYMATLYGLKSHAVRFNDLTNKYLVQLDGNSARTIPSESLTAPPASRPASSAAAQQTQQPEKPKTADDLLNDFLQADKMYATGQPIFLFRFDPYMSGMASGYHLVPNYCANSSISSGSIEGMTAFMKNGDPEANFSYASAYGFAYTSIFQWICGPANPGGASSSPINAESFGYATMIRWKGMFSELIAKRKQTVLPGFGADRDASIQAVPQNQAKLQTDGVASAADLAFKLLPLLQDPAVAATLTQRPLFDRSRE